MTDPHGTTSQAEAEAVADAGQAATAERAMATWALLLAAPIAWFAHFGVVYLLAEAACRFAWLEGEWLGRRALAVAILALTGLFLVPVVASTAVWWRRWHAARAAATGAPSGEQGPRADDRRGRGGGPDATAENRDRSLTFVGLALGLLFAASILAVGLPALALEPC